MLWWILISPISRFKSEYSNSNPSTWLRISNLTFQIFNSNCTSHYSDTTRMRNHWHWFSIWAWMGPAGFVWLFSAFLHLSTTVGGASRLCSRPSWRWRRTRWSGRSGGGGGQTVALLSVQRQASRRQRQSGQPRYIGNSFTALFIQSKKYAQLLHILHNCTYAFLAPLIFMPGIKSQVISQVVTSSKDSEQDLYDQWIKIRLNGFSSWWHEYSAFKMNLCKSE